MVFCWSNLWNIGSSVRNTDSTEISSVTQTW